MKNLSTGEEIHKSYGEMLTTYPPLVQNNVISSSEVVPDDSSAPQTIIGGDNRTPITNTTISPYSAIAHIECHFPDGSISDGTAWLASTNVAVTAGHCLYDSSCGGWATQVFVYPGRYGNTTYGEAYALELYIAQDYINTEISHTGHDWGMIWLSSNLGQSAGILSFTYFSDTNIANRYVRIAGYQANYTNSNLYPYEMIGNITTYTNTMLYYEIDTAEGYSGAPILGLGNTVLGIHTVGKSSNDPHILGQQYNYGTRITQYLYNLMYAYIAKCASTS